MAKVYGTKSVDVLNGFSDGVTNGDDTIFGLGGNDWIFGLDGNDILMGGEGADHLFGGNGYDTASYADSPSGVRVYLQLGQGYGGTAQGDTLEGIENLTGSFYDDLLVGDYHDNVLSGSWGDDILIGGAGADILNGGFGSDYASYSDSPAGVTVSLLWDTASGGDAEGDDLNSIEGLNGSKYDDGLMGDNGANELSGQDGNDTLFGLGGDDQLHGGKGSDSLYGGADNDSLRGAEGGDYLSGGPGGDTFVWSFYHEGEYESGGVLPSGDVDWANMDTVKDFTPGEDKIDVGGVDANAETPFVPWADDAFTFIGEYFAAGGFTAPGQVAYTKDATDTYLIFNTDDVYTINTVAEFEFAIRFSGLYTPDASWFINL